MLTRLIERVRAWTARQANAEITDSAKVETRHSDTDDSAVIREETPASTDEIGPSSEKEIRHISRVPQRAVVDLEEGDDGSSVHDVSDLEWDEGQRFYCPECGQLRSRLVVQEVRRPGRPSKHGSSRLGIRIACASCVGGNGQRAARKAPRSPRAARGLAHA